MNICVECRWVCELWVDNVTHLMSPDIPINYECSPPGYSSPITGRVETPCGTLAGKDVRLLCTILNPNGNCQYYKAKED